MHERYEEELDIKTIGGLGDQHNLEVGGGEGDETLCLA